MARIINRKTISPASNWNASHDRCTSQETWCEHVVSSLFQTYRNCFCDCDFRTVRIQKSTNPVPANFNNDAKVGPSSSILLKKIREFLEVQKNVSSKGPLTSEIRVQYSSLLRPCTIRLSWWSSPEDTVDTTIPINHISNPDWIYSYCIFLEG